MILKRAYVLILLSVAVVFIATSFFVADPPTAEIGLLAFSPEDVAADPTKLVSAGLPNIGVGIRVYLIGNKGDATITGYSWAIGTKPASSSAALDDASSQTPFFTPDTAGQYKITLTVTNADGTSNPVELWINAGTYVGVGTVGGATPDYKKSQCAVCHSRKEEAWAQTKHATALQKKIDGEGVSFFAESCLECHTVGYRDDAVNAGFDDVASDSGWTFPSTIEAGHLLDMVINFPEVAAKANVQCENCHGPGSEHAARTSKNQIAKSFESGVCEQCHDAAPYHIFPSQWQNSKHFVATKYPSGPSRGSCVQCHTGTGFITTYDNDYDEVNTTYSNINCQTCHDPHSRDNEHQIRKMDDVTLFNGFVASGGGLGQICMSCHMSRRDADEYVLDYHSHYGPHNGPQTDMLFGTNAIEFGKPVGISPHMDVVENTCVTCHMQEFTSTGDVKTDFGDPAMTDEKAEELRDNIYGHSFWNVYTDAADTKYENVKACNTCHVGITSFDDIKAQQDFDGDLVIEGVQSEVTGMLESLALQLPPIGDPAVTVTSAYTPVQLKAVYNYLFVKNDGSKGVHNAAYAFGLLNAAFNALNIGDIGAGAISVINDVPNDQGKQVELQWFRFPGDGDTDPKIVKYGVWRKVDNMTAKASKVAVNDFDEMFNQIGKAENLLFKVGESEADVWSFVKEVPAAELAAYATVAATIFDSTITSGMYWSYFRISGHGTNNDVVMSVADSGYSVDNLDPSVPAGLNASIVGNNVVLTWAEPVDVDFDNFAVYRSDTPGFTPDNVNLVGRVTTNSFEDINLHDDGTFFYRVSAFDYSGNESDASEEYQIIVTGVDGDIGRLPTKFDLGQNYPNPFNPATVIRYALPTASDVKITIYNLLGQVVRTLVQTYESAGIKQVTWNGLDDRGIPVSPGVYLYKMQAGSYVEIKKMVLVK
ncbi:T9SS type A sorting domain-containing protein [candidate division KSB1 bacterium]|nr:T9SS type A sorting domain-containing protein [candidate division KSB1 bacterium]